MAERGHTMGKEKKITKKEVLERIKSGALLTSKTFKVAVNKKLALFEAGVFVEWLNGNLEEDIPALLPKGFHATLAENTTGRGETLKVWRGTEIVDRVFFPSTKTKYRGWGVGKPMLKNMISVLDVPASVLCEVRQGQKEYWYNTDWDLLKEYFIRKYIAPDAMSQGDEAPESEGE